MQNSPPNLIQVRPATEDDVDIVIHFNLRLAHETEDIQLDPDVVSAGVQAALADPSKGRYFLAIIGDQVVGQLMHTWEWSDWRNGYLWWLQSVYVDSKHRQKGVFRTLWNHLVEMASEDGNVAGLRLYVEHDNDKAQSVYRQLGLTGTGYQVMERVPLHP
jgi:ribosomal protein S18 acetylase RimI-like enzyme